MAQISSAEIAQLICAFVFTWLCISRLSCYVAQMIFVVDDDMPKGGSAVVHSLCSMN